jgi:hypothetical protein
MHVRWLPAEGPNLLLTAGHLLLQQPDQQRSTIGT